MFWKNNAGKSLSGKLKFQIGIELAITDIGTPSLSNWGPPL
jgi:hypothetical protein